MLASGEWKKAIRPSNSTASAFGGHSMNFHDNIVSKKDNSIWSAKQTFHRSDTLVLGEKRIAEGISSKLPIREGTYDILWL